MSVQYLDASLRVQEGPFDKIFDTRDPYHLLRPYFDPISWNYFRRAFNVMYCRSNYRIETSRLFDYNTRIVDILPFLYANDDFCTNYSFTLPFLSTELECNEETFVVHIPARNGSWETKRIPIRFDEDYAFPNMATVEAVKEALILVAGAITMRPSASIAQWLSGFPNNEYPDATILKWLQFYGNQYVIFAENGNGSMRPSDFAQYPATWELKYDLFGKREAKELTSISVDRSALYQVFSYTQPVHQIFGRGVVKHKRVKGKKVFTVEGPSYGVELELVSDHPQEYLIDTQEEPFFILKADSSISGKGDYRYELVTRPMDFRSQRTHWGKWFASIWDEDKKDYTGFDCSKATTNGMHVHVGRGSFQKFGHADKFLWFFTDPANHEFLRFVSERGKKMGDYCSFPSNDYFSTSRKKDYKNVRGIVSGNGRGAVFMSSKNTFEVRIFKGLVSYATVMKNLEFVDSVFYFTEQAGYCKLTLNGYFEWLATTPSNKYKTLKKFLEGTPKEILAESSLMMVFHGCKEASDAIKIVEARNLKPDKRTLIFLNKHYSKFGNRAFTIKDGKYILNITQFAALKPLDGVNPFKGFLKKDAEAPVTSLDPYPRSMENDDLPYAVLPLQSQRLISRSNREETTFWYSEGSV